MSKRKRRHLSAEFKARIAREAMENQKTIQQIAKDNDIAPTQVSAWKKELESRVSEIFERKNATNEAAVNFEKKSARLERRIGQLLIEKEFLEGKCEELGSTRAKSDDHTEPPQALSSASV
ncbi:transposase [Akkermansiaceae bacterium]|nr:transposase [Akkermansiaceae bacterium]